MRLQWSFSLHFVKNVRSNGSKYLKVCKFFEIMQTYYSKYKFKNAKTSDFLSVVEEVAGKAAAERVDLH